MFMSICLPIILFEMTQTSTVITKSLYLYFQTSTIPLESIHSEVGILTWMSSSLIKMTISQWSTCAFSLESHKISMTIHPGSVYSF